VQGNPPFEGSRAVEDPDAVVLAGGRALDSLLAMTTDTYVMGRTAEEYERLRDQARMWEPETARMLGRIGLGPGARCLDVGCGAGEVMRLMAERTGRGGEVLGIDVDDTLAKQAIADLHAGGHTQCAFERLDVESGDPVPGAPFDLVFARLLLLHVDDRVAVLQRLWKLVAPGGYLVVQDYDLLSSEVFPPLDVVDEFRRVALGTYWRAGLDLRLGLNLPSLHLEAGLGEPDGMDAGARAGTLPALAPMYEAVYRSMLPTAISFGLTTQESAARWFEDFAKQSAAAGGHGALWPLLIGTWKRKGEV
jgi:ubiquinone/menaquinone biosynthesis C-methylase UbiE